MPCGGRRPLTLGRGQRLARGGQVRLRLRQLLAGRLVPLGDLLVVRVQPVDLGLELFVLLLGGGRPAPGVIPGLGQPADLRLRRGGPATGRGDLSAQPRQALATVGDGPGHVPQPPFLVRQLPLQLGTVFDGVLQRPARRLQRGRQLRLLLADPGGLALHVLGVAPVPLLRRGRRGALHPRLGQRDRAAHPLRELGELVPGLLRALHPRRERTHLLLQRRLLLLGTAQPVLGGLLAFLERRLVRDLGAQRPAQGDEVVGEQPQPGVAQVRLDDGGAPGDRGLPSQGLELAPQLIGQILDAGEVGLHRVQLPQRLFLALAVLEDAGRLLDKGPASHRIGVQNGVELALPDDDMHLPADSGIGEQFLDVQQPAGVTVDLVLTAAIAEHDPGDGDFGVLDRQCTVGVVDGERDLGTAERRPPGRPGEDDVLHLPAAQRLGALLAHDPGQRVHDIGLAGAVGTHDAGDARLEPQRRGGGEGLETSQGQTLEMHAVGLYRPLLGGRPQHSGADHRPVRPPGIPSRSFSVSLTKAQGTSCGKGGAARRKMVVRSAGNAGVTQYRETTKGRRSVPCRS